MNDLNALLTNIREHSIIRRASVYQQRRMNNSIKALLRILNGYDGTHTEKERNKAKKKANAAFSHYEDVYKEKGELINGEATLYKFLVEPWLKSRDNIDMLRASVEKSMKANAKKLDVWEWVEQVPGVGPFALSLIIGEAGNLSQYNTPAKLWKRMGLAVVGGERQGKGLTRNAEKAAEHGYNPERRSTMFTIGEAMIKKKGMGGKYAELYDQEKERQKQLHPELTPAHAHNRAKRRMEKEFLKDLWVKWREYYG